MTGWRAPTGTRSAAVSATHRAQTHLRSDPCPYSQPHLLAAERFCDPGGGSVRRPSARAIACDEERRPRLNETCLFKQLLPRSVRERVSADQHRHSLAPQVAQGVPAAGNAIKMPAGITKYRPQQHLVAWGKGYGENGRTPAPLVDSASALSLGQSGRWGHSAVKGRSIQHAACRSDACL